MTVNWSPLLKDLLASIGVWNWTPQQRLMIAILLIALMSKHRYYCQRKKSCTWQELLLRLLHHLFNVGLFVWRPRRIYLTARLRNKMVAESGFPTRIDLFCRVVKERCKISSVNRRMGQRFFSIRPSELLCSKWQIAKQERKFSQTTSTRVQVKSYKFNEIQRPTKVEQAENTSSDKNQKRERERERGKERKGERENKQKISRLEPNWHVEFVWSTMARAEVAAMVENIESHFIVS